MSMMRENLESLKVSWGIDRIFLPKRMESSAVSHRANMKTLPTYILLFATLTACAQEKTKSVRPIESPELLEHAYKVKSQAELEQFLGEWSKNTPPVSEQELQGMPALQREAYRVFTVFYKPHQLDSLGGSEWGNTIYQNAKFLLVQNSINIHRENSSERDSVADFRPVVAISGKKCVYLTSARETTLTAFLGNIHARLGASGIMQPAHSKGESEKRKQFLENVIKIWYGHWGGYWQLYSYPVAYTITFDKDMSTAKVDFRMVYEGGAATLKKVNGQWKLISSRRTWIE
jgi:hypothetical protein